MSEEFLRVARQEVQSEIDMLQEILLYCADDHQLYEKSNDIERHMHKIKGLAPMMGQEDVGEIARISDIIVKHIAKHGALNGSHDIIANAIKTMQLIFSGKSDAKADKFAKQAKAAHPHIAGL